MFFRAIGEFAEVISFRYTEGRDLITISEDEGEGWINNFRLFGRFSPTSNVVKLNNYISEDGGNWKSYVFLAKKTDPLMFNKRDPNFLLLSFYIPGMYRTITIVSVRNNNNRYILF